MWRLLETSGEAPCARTGHAMTVLHTPAGPLVMVVGGCSAAHGHLADVHCLDTSSWTWSALNDAPFTPRDKLTTVAIGSRVLVWGGFGPQHDGHSAAQEHNNADEEDEDGEDDSGADEEEDEKEEERPDGASFTWFDELFVLERSHNGAWAWSAQATRGDAPSARAAHAAVAIGSRMFVFGGRDASGRVADTHSLDAVDYEWRRAPADAPAPAARSFHNMAALPPPLAGAVCFGGVSADGTPLDSLEVLDARDAAKPVWMTVKERAGTWPAARSGAAAALLGSRLVLLGGNGADDKPCADAVLDLADAMRALQHAPVPA